MRRAKPDPYWTQERVVDGLRRFWRRFGLAPRSSSEMDRIGQPYVNGRRRAFPPKGQILRWFPTMIEVLGSDGNRSRIAALRLRPGHQTSPSDPMP